MYADIYKQVDRESLLGNIYDVLANIANGYDMTDIDSYIAFYSDGPWSALVPMITSLKE